MIRKKVLFLTNIPAPYRVDFFNELGKYFELTVSFEGTYATDRNQNWKADEALNYCARFIPGIRVAADEFFCVGILKVLKEQWDAIILGQYATPTAMMDQRI